MGFKVELASGYEWHPDYSAGEVVRCCDCWRTAPAARGTLTHANKCSLARGRTTGYEAAAAESKSAATGRKANAYKGVCGCGVHVPAGAGFLGPKVEGRWTVQCPSCVGSVTGAAAHLVRVADAAREGYAALVGSEQDLLDAVKAGYVSMGDAANQDF